MNQRVVELLRNPKIILQDDIRILDKEITKFPYMQSLRALQLYGIHLYQKEQYAKALSTTAAYTTDKKILYQFINGKVVKQNQYESIAESHVEELAMSVNSKVLEQNLEVTMEIINDSEPIVEDILIEKTDQTTASECTVANASFETAVVDEQGNPNRILYPGEENFLNELNTPTIDVEMTLESGKIVLNDVQNDRIEPKEDLVAKTESLDNLEVIADDSIASTQLEVTINEHEDIDNTIETSKAVSLIETVEASSELSFHASESFLPNVKIESKKSEISFTAPISQAPLSKHEEEMKKLIEEVERKMKEKKAIKEIAEEIQDYDLDSNEINFADTQVFDFTEPQLLNDEVTIVEEVPISEVIDTLSTDQQQEEHKDWKPMNIASNPLDALINTKEDASINADELIHTTSTDTSDVEVPKENNVEIQREVDGSEDVLSVENLDIIGEEEISDTPVINMSFFSPTIASIEVETKEEIAVEDSRKLELEDHNSIDANTALDSNISTFIHTWQDWLKIDRTAEIEAQKAEQKEKIIDSFIETNPKISQLKDEVSFVIKEKSDDISHLMTETLANIYLEQKLYSKAISAFTVLQEKYPEKTGYFESRIQDIKDLRSKN